MKEKEEFSEKELNEMEANNFWIKNLSNVYKDTQTSQ